MQRSINSASTIFNTVPRCSNPGVNQIFELIDFVRSARKLLVLTGAGVSTESGIRDYRSAGIGEYALMKQPILSYQEFKNSEDSQKRFWLRNFLKWPTLSAAQPNSAHYIFAQWERRGCLSHVVTQNVDGLHTKAGSRKVLEFHGSMDKVICMRCGDQSSREDVQQRLMKLNTPWLQRMDPSKCLQCDGEISISDEYIRRFKIPRCLHCSGVMKPNMLFFGEKIPRLVVDRVTELVGESDAVLVAGSSLQVYSGYYIVHEAKKFGKKVGIINVGSTRADDLADLRITSKCGDALETFEFYEREFA